MAETTGLSRSDSVVERNLPGLSPSGQVRLPDLDAARMETNVASPCHDEHSCCGHPALGQPRMAISALRGFVHQPQAS